ncbi:MAG: tetratricopeptide repeat protein, partial [Alphaproteobacteria bacterium]|nr:tetratricopeptide repeat protein [Alphaproteobacteria bacterium]
MNKVMLKIMLKMSFTLSVVVLTVLACSHDAWNLLWQKNNQISASDFDESGYLEVPGAKLKLDKNKGDIAYYSTNSLYGAYLAGRVANIRNDFPTAVEYYKIVLDKKPESNEINNWVYVLMTASGNLEEAAKYAQRELDNQKFGVMAPLVVSSYAFKHEDYARVHEVLKVKNDKVYHEMVYPFLEAWAYAGENKEAEAIAELDKIVTKGADIQTLKHFHKGLIYDYFNKVDEASKEFETINSKYPTEMSFRKLEVITDFYVRRGRPEMAEVLAKKYVNNSSLSVLLKDIRERISGRRSDEQIVIDTVQKGVADVMFNLNVMFRLANLDNMFAILFNGMSIYLNPDYDATKISMASVLESNGFYDIANDYYRQVKSDSGYYYIAQTRIVLNQHKENKLKEAKQTLADLLKAYPQDAQLWSEYGNILSSLDDQKEAIKAYKQSISLLPENDKENWSIYYALAV